MNDDEGKATDSYIKIFMCGDVMTGRGIDQVLPHPSDPKIYEPYVKNARDYVRFAETANGAIPKPVSYSYFWGDALTELNRMKTDVKIINLETSITKSNDYWKGKGINYRMSPENTPCLTAAKINYCSLANNHVLDWGYAGLTETLETLRKANIKTSGAGQNIQQVQAAARIPINGKATIAVLSFGTESSGIPQSWAAAEDRPGVNLLRDLSVGEVHHIAELVKEIKQSRTIVIASIHWGANWGYRVYPQERNFAHKLIDEAGVDVIHGHSSHHPKGIEVYHNKLILYGCGDFLNDYEGIGGYENFRSDLSLMYFAAIEQSTGNLTSLEMTPTQLKRFRVNRAIRNDAQFLREILNREGQGLGSHAELNDDKTITLSWSQ